MRIFLLIVMFAASVPELDSEAKQLLKVARATAHEALENERKGK
jgi:hypothetical protein